jgi:predicted enzyme related to lactoylglutathione lyase
MHEYWVLYTYKKNVFMLFWVYTLMRYNKYYLKKDVNSMVIKYVHTNIIAKDWRKLSLFYQRVFGCKPVPPERDLSGQWLDSLTGIDGAHITGEHLALPGYDGQTPTLEIFSYDDMDAIIQSSLTAWALRTLLSRWTTCPQRCKRSWMKAAHSSEK